MRFLICQTAYSDSEGQTVGKREPDDETEIIVGDGACVYYEGREEACVCIKSREEKEERESAGLEVRERRSSDREQEQDSNQPHETEGKKLRIE